MLKKIPKNAQEVHTYNSQYTAHYAQGELTIMFTETDIRHEETRLHYYRVQPFQFYHVLGLKSGHQLTDQPFPSPQYVV